jgi:hypothetical protein
LRVRQRSVIYSPTIPSAFASIFFFRAAGTPNVEVACAFRFAAVSSPADFAVFVLSGFLAFFAGADCSPPFRQS